MSLLDDVSIVVTPNGYKAGELYAVVPVPTEGSELVTNGDFATDTDWNKTGTWSIESNYATASGNSTSQYIQQDFTITNGKTYSFTYEIIENTLNGNGASLSGSGGFVSVSLSSVIGTHQVYITADDSGAVYALKIGVSGTATTGTIKLDNVSVKEYTAADMDVTRATAATRVDENGLVNYAEIIGGEEVTNGDFSTDSDWNKGTGITIGSGVALFTSVSSGLQLSQSSTPAVSGKTYKISYEIKTRTEGAFSASIGGALSSNQNSAVGVYTEYLTATGAGIFYIRSRGTTSGSIDNVSLKEVTRDNVPRIDYTGGGCPHILAEPQRTNLITYSSDFSQWLIYDTITRTANYGTSPDGTQNSFEIGSSGASNDFMYLSLSISASQSHSLSFFIKNVDSVESKFFTPSESTTTITWSGSGITSISDGTYESFGNGWYKITSTATSQSDGGYISRFYPSTSGTASVELYGYQVEEGSYATSYIPTSGSTVTRNQDIFTRDGIGSLINSTEGVLFAEMAALGDDGTIRYLSVNDGSSNNRVTLLYYSSGTNIRVIVSSGGTNYVDKNSGVSSILDFHKVAIKWKVDDFALWIDGIKVQTDTSGLVPIGLNTLSLDVAGSNNFFGKVKQLQVYDTALTDTQLAALTS